MEAFPKDRLTKGQEGCKGGYHENLGQYNFIMMMEEGCEKKKNDFEFTVQVKEHEQKGISAWYNKQDHRGAYLNNSEKLLVKPCESQGDGTLKCTYRLGYYEDYIERGFAQPWQTVAAYAGAPDYYGWMRVSTLYTVTN